MIRFENVGLRYGNGPEVLKDINLELEPGSFQFLTGPSGAGKTSLLRLLFLAQRPTRGPAYMPEAQYRHSFGHMAHHELNRQTNMPLPGDAVDFANGPPLEPQSCVLHMPAIMILTT